MFCTSRQKKKKKKPTGFRSRHSAWSCCVRSPCISCRRIFRHRRRKKKKKERTSSARSANCLVFLFVIFFCPKKNSFSGTPALASNKRVPASTTCVPLCGFFAFGTAAAAFDGALFLLFAWALWEEELHRRSTTPPPPPVHTSSSCSVVSSYREQIARQP